MPSWLLVILLNMALYSAVLLFDKGVMQRIQSRMKKPWQVLVVLYTEITIVVTLITIVFGASMVWPTYVVMTLSGILVPWRIRIQKKVQKDLFHYDIKVRTSDVQGILETLKVHQNLKRVARFLSSRQELKEEDFSFTLGRVLAPFRFKIQPETENRYLVEMSFDTEKVPFSPEQCMTSFIMSCRNVLGIVLERKDVTLSAEEYSHETKIYSAFVHAEDIVWQFSEVQFSQDEKFYFGFNRSELPFRHLSRGELNTRDEKEIGKGPFVRIATCGELLELTFSPFEQFDEVYELARLFVDELAHLPVNVKCQSDMLEDWQLIQSWDGWLGTDRQERKPKRIQTKREDEPHVWQELRKVHLAFEQNGDGEAAIQAFNEAIRQRHWEFGGYGKQFLTIEAGKPVFDQRRNVCQVCGKELEENNFANSVQMPGLSFLGMMTSNFVTCCGSDKCMESLRRTATRNVEVSQEMNKSMAEVFGGIAKK
jgi:hypothetical protein